jgi:ribosomal protein S18 acetylase RimI-like enzyme
MGFVTPTAQLLEASQEIEVLQFLSERPLHTVTMVGFIRDNGLVSPLNRGNFYGYRNFAGKLEGVALIGHATLIEARSEEALRALAITAQSCNGTHMVLGERAQVLEFWKNYSATGQKMRLACTELLFELKWPVAVPKTKVGLRRATEDELDLVMPVQAQMALEESGVDPRLVDPVGFANRCLRRIQQGRTWVVVKNQKLLFKAEIISDALEVIYLEGVWTDETERRNGFATSCLTQLARELLCRTSSICLLVNKENRPAHALYRKSGFRLRSTYDTIFLQRQDKSSGGNSY